MLKRLWLASSRKRFALHIPDQANDTDCLSPITFSPPHQVLECCRVKFDAPHSPSFAGASSREMPSRRCKAARRRSFIPLDLSKYAVSRSEAISLHNSIGTITAVGSPASLETI